VTSDDHQRGVRVKLSATLGRLSSALLGLAGGGRSGGRRVATSTVALFVLIAAMLLLSTGPDAAGVATAAPPPGSWTPKFDDEFSKDAALNTASWTPGWFGTGITGPVNGTCLSSANVLLGAGTPNFFSTLGSTLNLWLKPVASQCGKTRSPYTGALVSSNPRDGVSRHAGFSQTYGYFEAQIYLPPAPDGTVANWPAWWMDGQVWPQDGEIDIVEGLGGKACFHFHFSRNNPPGGCVSGKAGKWHTFGVDWEASSITWYYDGLQVGQVTSNVTSSPMYLILNNCQGKYGGTTVVPSDMQVSYVRVWQH
jgi:hypothetical protein